MARLVVKLGSSVVAQPDGRVRGDVVAHVCDVVADRRRRGDEVVVVCSGAIARGVRLLGLPARPTAIADLQACSAAGQGRIYRAWDDELTERGLRPAQVLLTSRDVDERVQYLNARRTLQRLLELGAVPVINENDTTTTDEISFGDNDFLAAQVAVLTGADRLVLLTDLDGLFTADPRTDPGAELVHEVADVAQLAGVAVGESTSALGSGGMRSKLVAAQMATSAGIPSVIGNGVAPGVLARLLDGDARTGTRFLPTGRRASSFKLWLRYAKPARGTVLVDAGAARALRDGGTSLLPVGITRVEGAFEAGDAIEVREDGGTALGKGITNYAAGELARIAGLKSAQVLELLPAAVEEAVHRDQFVLAE
jgi:glutamate 5-kinase